MQQTVLRAAGGISCGVNSQMQELIEVAARVLCKGISSDETSAAIER
jgi:hypothetical protein